MNKFISLDSNSCCFDPDGAAGAKAASQAARVFLTLLPVGMLLLSFQAM
jgi:hypothetical protein